MGNAATVEDLGVGEYEGQRKVIEYGPSGAKERHFVDWDEDEEQWIGLPIPMVTLRDAWIMNGQGSGANNIGQWGYVTFPIGNPGQFGQSSYSWNPRAIRHADAAFAGGFKLQLHTIGTMWVFDAAPPPRNIDLGVILYSMGTGDQISNVNIPDDAIAATMRALVTQRRPQDTGWQDSLIQESAKPNLAPHLYSRWEPGSTASLCSLEHLFVEWRWVAVPS